MGTLQDRTKGSSVCAVRTSSQSLDRVVECAIEMTGGNFNEDKDFDKVAAFRAKEPWRGKVQF